jgi:hypothetical protein
LTWNHPRCGRGRERRCWRRRTLFFDAQTNCRRDHTSWYDGFRPRRHWRRGGDRLDRLRLCDRYDRFFDRRGRSGLHRFGSHFDDRFGGRRRLLNRSRSGCFFDDRFGFDSGGNGHRFRRFHQARRRQYRGHRLGRLWRLLRGRRLLALLDGRLRENVARWQRDAPLLREPIHELARDDFFDRAGRALDFDAVIALQQRGHFLARGAE